MNGPATDKNIYLKKAGLFSKLKEDELSIVGEYSEFYTLAENDHLFKQGELLNQLYIVKEGEIAIYKSDDHSNRTEIARILPGECFGEIELLDDRPASASAVCSKKSELLIFPKKGIRFEDLLTRNPNLFARILFKFIDVITNRIRHTNKLISEKTTWIGDIKNQLYKDKMTGFYNKSFLDDELPRKLSSIPFVLMFIKPDNFKKINDNFGHDAGDQSIAFMGKFYSLYLEANDYLIRYKGDEYIVILTSRNYPEGFQTAHRIREDLSHCTISELTGGTDFYIQASIGLSGFENGTDDLKQAVKEVYDKMLVSRNSGGNQVIEKL